MKARALATVAAAALLLGITEVPAHAVCNNAPDKCTRLVHSTASAKSVISVTSRWPAQSGSIYSLARGTGGSYVGFYNPQGYKVRVTKYDGGKVVSDFWWYPTGWYAANSAYDQFTLSLTTDGQID